MTEVTFNSHVPKSPFDHYGNVPINWSGITKIVKIDETYSASHTMDDRDMYYLHIVMKNKGAFRIHFQFDRELRDKVFDLIKDHQENHLKVY